MYEALSKLIQNCGYAIVRTLYRINSDTLKSGRVKLYEIHSLTQNKLKQFVQLKEQKSFMLLYQGKKKTLKTIINKVSKKKKKKPNL